MSGMDPVTATVRSKAAGAEPPSPRQLRTREPQGVIDAAEATERLAALGDHEVSGVDSSLGRIVVALATAPPHLLVISGPISHIGPDGVFRVVADPGFQTASRQLRQWVGRLVTGLEVEQSGALRLTLGHDQLWIPAAPDYEAWEIRGMDGGLFACLPGGAISLWTPTFGRIPAAT